MRPEFPGAVRVSEGQLDLSSSFQLSLVGQGVVKVNYTCLSLFGTAMQCISSQPRLALNRTPAISQMSNQTNANIESPPEFHL